MAYKCSEAGDSCASDVQTGGGRSSHPSDQVDPLRPEDPSAEAPGDGDPLENHTQHCPLLIDRQVRPAIERGKVTRVV